MLPAMTLNNRLSKDVEALAGGDAAEAVPMTRLQRTVARRMAAAKAEIPEFTAELEVDMGAVRELRERLRGADGKAPSYNDFAVRACALALRAVPKLNTSYSPDGVIAHAGVNVGVAVASGGALVVPTVFDADLKPVEEIAAEIRALAAKVKEGSIRVEELSGGTFTVSNLGMHGVSRFTAIISPPQVGILALGAIREEFVPGADGAPVLRPRMAAVLSSDHRVVYGADAAEFLRAFQAALEQPSKLIETNDFLEEDR